jgi:hypothetical protein
MRTVRVQYTNPGKSGEKQSPPKITTRPIHKVAVVVPVGYVFEDDVCDNEVSSRGRKWDLEAAKIPGWDPAQTAVGEPKAGGAQPVGRKRRGRPKKSERPTVVDSGPQAEPRNNAGMVADAGAPPGTEDQPPAGRRGRSRDLGPRGQRDRGRSC